MASDMKIEEANAMLEGMVKDPNKVVIYEIKYLPDGSVDVTLSHVHRQLLCFLASRGGECPYDYEILRRQDPEWDRKDRERFGEPLVDHVKRLTKMGLTKDIPLLGGRPDQVTLRLTDMGRNIVTQILKSQGQVL